jgi:ribonuclease HI
MAVALSLFHIYDDLKEGDEALVFINSDSAYIVNCFLQRWYEKWERLDFSNVKNEEYWKVILELSLCRGMRVTYKWIPGHKGIEHNESVDRLALEARLSHQSELK